MFIYFIIITDIIFCNVLLYFSGWAQKNQKRTKQPKKNGKTPTKNPEKCKKSKQKNKKRQKQNKKKQTKKSKQKKEIINIKQSTYIYTCLFQTNTIKQQKQSTNKLIDIKTNQFHNIKQVTVILNNKTKNQQNQTINIH